MATANLPVTPDIRKFEDLPEQQQDFVRYVAAGKDVFEAYPSAGYSTEGRGWKANARKLSRRLAPHIQEAVTLRISTLAPTALNVVEKLLAQATSEKVQLDAAKWALTTAGYDQPIKVDLTARKADEMSPDEIRDELRQMLSQALTNGALTVPGVTLDGDAE